MAADSDLVLGRRARFGAAVRMAVVWLLLGVAGGLSARSGWFVPEHGSYALGVIAFMVLTAPFVWRNRAGLFGNAVNRRITESIYVVLSAIAAFWGLTWWLDVPFVRAMPVVLLALTTCASVLAVFVERRLFVGASAFASAALASLFLPAYGYELLGLANLVALGHTAWVWSPCEGAASPVDHHRAVIRHLAVLGHTAWVWSPCEGPPHQSTTTGQ